VTGAIAVGISLSGVAIDACVSAKPASFALSRKIHLQRMTDFPAQGMEWLAQQKKSD
jgi:hypothetical protein